MVLVAGAVCRVPGSHWLTATHWGAFCMLENVSGGQSVHWRSAEVVPAAET
jgi:hypothetical protein